MQILMLNFLYQWLNLKCLGGAQIKNNTFA